MFQENFAKMLRKRYFRGNLHCLGDRLGKSVPAAGQKNKVRESSRFGSPTHFLRCFHPELPCFALIRHAFPSSRHSVPGIPSGPRIAPERGCPSRSTSMEREDGSWFQRWRSGRRAAGETPAVRPAHSIRVYLCLFVSFRWKRLVLCVSPHHNLLWFISRWDFQRSDLV